MQPRLLVLAVAAVAGGLLVAGSAGRAADDPHVARGKALFASVGCYECHGYAGQGGASGPRIADTKIPLAAFTAFVRHPAREMPPFTTKVMPDSDLAAIYAYLQSLPAPRAASAAR